MYLKTLPKDINFSMVKLLNFTLTQPLWGWSLISGKLDILCAQVRMRIIYESKRGIIYLSMDIHAQFQN